MTDKGERLGKRRDTRYASNEDADAFDAALAALVSRLKEAEAVAQDALDILGPCDDDNAHVEVWCINHQEKRCDVPDLRRRLAALSTPPNQGETTTPMDAIGWLGSSGSEVIDMRSTPPNQEEE